MDYIKNRQTKMEPLLSSIIMHFIFLNYSSKNVALAIIVIQFFDHACVNLFKIDWCFGAFISKKDPFNSRFLCLFNFIVNYFIIYFLVQFKLFFVCLILLSLNFVVLNKFFWCVGAFYSYIWLFWLLLIFFMFIFWLNAMSFYCMHGRFFFSLLSGRHNLTQKWIMNFSWSWLVKVFLMFS